MRELWAKITSALRRRGLDEDLAEEMRAHHDLMVEDNIATGMTSEEARAAARRHFGNVALTHELAREAWQFPRIETFFQDVRYAFRGMRRAPGFALFVALTLALGIGANTAIFSVVRAVLLRPLPFPGSERLVRIGEDTPKAKDISVSWINYRHWRGESRSFEAMAGSQFATYTLTGRGEASITTASVVTHDYFALVGSRTLLGRTFSDEEDRPGAAPVAVLTHEFWSKRLGSDPGILSTGLVLDGKPHHVIGVLAPAPPVFIPVDYYVPLGPQVGNATSRGTHSSMRVLAKMKEGVTLSAARADLNGIMERLGKADPGPEADHRAAVQSLAASRTGQLREPLWILMGAVGLVLLLACANVASLLMVRGTARMREMAVRAAIGAGRARLTRQLITENLTLAAVGGVCGLGLAWAALRAIIAFAPAAIPRLEESRLDPMVLAFAAMVTCASGVAVGFAPLRAASRLDLTAAIKEGVTAGAGRGTKLRNALVIAEIAVTLALVFASALLVRSLASAQNGDPGFDSARLLALELQLPSSRYKSGRESRQYFDDLMARISAEPGVESVGAINCPPSAGSCGDWWYSIVEKPAPARDEVPVSLFNTAGDTYFRAMRIRLLAGREFNASDREGPRTAIVNAQLTSKWWPDPRQAVGNRIKVGGPYADGNVFEIVGVVSNVAQLGLDTDPQPEIYFPFSRGGSRSMAVMIRAKMDPDALMPAVRRHVAAIDAAVPVKALGRFEDKLGASLALRRFSTMLLGAFALLAVALAFVGIHGVLNYWVGVRRKEIALRIALGAQDAEIARWAGWHALRLAAPGIALGAAASWAASGWLKSSVYGVSESDPAMLAAAAAGVLGLALMAASVPVWRATRVDPVRNLQE